MKHVAPAGWLSLGLLCGTLLRAAPGATAPESVKIPLEMAHDEEGHLRVGIQVSVGGGPPMIYEFDTGNPVFYAGFNTHPTETVPNWWGNFTAVGEPPRTGNVTFTSGVHLDYMVVKTSVTLGLPGSGSSVTAPAVEIGRITNGYGSDIGPADRGHWDGLIEDGVGPLHGVFYGSFGGSLSEHQGLSSILGQLPGNLSSGFIVHLGDINHPDPHLIVGLTEELRKQFPYAVAMRPMTGANGQPARFPNSGRPHFQEFPVVASFQIKDGATTWSLENEATLLDTGAPTTNIRKAMNPALMVNGTIRAGAVFQLTLRGAGTPDYGLNFPTGNISSLNLIRTNDKKAAGDINVGLIPFFHADVMYDLEKGVLRLRPLAAPKP